MQEYDPGYVREPFKSLVEQYPGVEVYPQDAFRTEWGPIFHRGRLDGTARVLVIGQDPAQHETILRRILVGEAGTRLQGFLGKLGIDKSYTLINTFLYSVYGSAGGQHKHDARIQEYRNRWIDAVVSTEPFEAIVALGQLADDAYKTWKTTASGAKSKLTYAAIIHPTEPESASRGNKAKHAEEMQKMLQNWNAGLQAIAPAIVHPDTRRSLVLYGTDFAPGDKLPIPARDLPAGTPPWMYAKDGWAVRAGATPAEKRATITVTVPKPYLPKA